MKNFLLLLTFISTGLFAQDASWFETGATWTYQYKENGFMEVETHLAIFSITEQTTLNGQACAKMEATGNNSNPLNCNAAWPPYYLYESDDSIFFATDYDNTFRLAYDFGAEPGDTWEFIVPIDIFETETVYMVTVNNVTTTEIDGQELKQMNLNYQHISGDDSYIGWQNLPVTEKIGAVPFLIPFGKWSVCENHFNDSIRCYSDSQIAYLAPDFSSCFLGLNDTRPEVNMGIYPNPAQNTFTLEVWDNRILEIQIYTVSGKRIFSNGFDNHKIEVNTSAFKAGLYHISVQTEKGLVYKKLVVQ